jgi:small subunit ribosomal protein S6
MRDYEVVYIFKSSLTTEEIEGRLEGYHGKILALDGSEITAVEHWGKRQLAYPIDRNDNGYYVVTQFTASPGVLPDFERMLKLDDDLLRHLVVLSEGELPVPVQYERGDDDRGNSERRGRRDDDDEVRSKAADKVTEDDAVADDGEATAGEDDAVADDAEATADDDDAADDGEATAKDDDAADDGDVDGDVDADEDDDVDATRGD